MPIKSQIRMGAFLYALIFVMALGVQLIVLPFMLPKLHWGHGLLVGNDSIRVHEVAVEQSDEIHIHGWSQWPRINHPWIEWRGWKPGIPMHGLASVIYALTVQEPYILIPLQAFFYSGTLLILIHCAYLFLGNLMLALIAISPAIFFLTPMGFYAGLTKDAMGQFGFSLFLLALVKLLGNWTEDNKRRLFLIVLALLVPGGLLVWVTRPATLALVLLCAVPVALWNLLFAAGQIKIAFLKSLPIVVITLMVMFLPWSKDPSSKLGLSAGIKAWEEVPWYPTRSVPARVDELFHSISRARRGYVFEGYFATSSMDLDVAFRNIGDVMKYTPRALQIALFAPFPNQWFSEGSLPTSRVLRRVASFEMAFTYVCYLFLLYAIFVWYRSPQFWLLILVPLVMLLNQGLIVVNLGTLYRTRFLYIMVLNLLGMSGLMHFLSRLRSLSTVEFKIPSFETLKAKG